MAMKKAVKKRWVAALRSGEYDQTQEKLFDGENGFCCLGVLCDIQGDGDKNPPSDTGGLPMWMLDQVNLSVSEEQQLIELNDTKKYTFSEIADYIETVL
jgi:hypothetical protein